MAPKIMLLAALLAVGTGVAAQPVCTAPVRPELAGWSQRSPVTAATLVPGKAVDAALLKSTDVRYPVAPQKSGTAATYGGVFGFTVTAPGTYRVALDQGAWIDVLAGGKPVTATAHGHGPDCSGVRKMVDFPLTAGPHVLQIAANATPAIAVMIVRLP